MRHTTFNIMLLFVFLLFISRYEYCYSNNVGCFEGERIALLRFKDSLIDKSNRLSSWTGLDCCKWEGVFCSSTTGHVSKLDLHNTVTDDIWKAFEGLPSKYSNNCLGGEINPSLINLTHLDYLDLSLNNFSGIQIPEFLGFFKNLRYLNLSSSGFVGNVPTHLGNLSSLEYLHLGAAPIGLYYSFFTTTAPVGLYYSYLTTDNLDWLANLSFLKSLDMSGILFDSKDWLYTINKLVSLSSLNLAYCFLNTTRPPSHVNSSSLISLNLELNSLDSSILPWLSNLTRLEHLILTENTFTGTLIPLCKLHSLVSMELDQNCFQGLIPNCLGNLTYLTFLSLEGNRFTGSIPKSISRLCRLQKLDFSRNKLTDSIGVLPDCLLSSLQELYLDNNNFTGQLPNQLYKYKNLKTLSLYSNSFSGPIAESLGNLSMLQSLVIGQNKFSGSIPLSLGELSNLEELDISDNFFTAILSESHFSKLSKLTDLLISRNLLVWNVSSNWVPPFQIEAIAMNSIKIGPHFPHWLRTQEFVEFLFMSNASISDAIPDWFEIFFWTCNQVDLSRNQISGELPMKPHVEGYMKASLEFLVLSYNHLTGGIPKWLCSFKYLHVLDVSTNKLSGEIPPCLGELQNLFVLDLASNNLYGCIPNLLGSLPQLQSLHLQNNKLEGELPSSLQNLRSLRILDLSENELMDVIPPWIGEKLSSMRFLILHTNKFHGNIPFQLCQLHDLQVLNLGDNNISGYIPECFDNLTGMVSSGSLVHYHYYMYEGSTYEDQIYEDTKGLTLQYNKTLSFLRSIDLSRNHLVGKIPMGVTSLHALENLNLSRNHLSGPIPVTIGNLSKIESLDLSRNMLSGPIPASLSSLAFLSYLNLSFNNLYGRIPTGSQLRTLNDPFIYIGNEGLCGAPLPKSCPGDEPSFVNQPTETTSSSDDHEFFTWFYAGMGPGFFVGFIGVLSILLFKKSWRSAYFKFLRIVYNKILCSTSVKG